MPSLLTPATPADDKRKAPYKKIFQLHDEEEAPSIKEQYAWLIDGAVESLPPAIRAETAAGDQTMEVDVGQQGARLALLTARLNPLESPMIQVCRRTMPERGSRRSSVLACEAPCTSVPGALTGADLEGAEAILKRLEFEQQTRRALNLAV